MKHSLEFVLLLFAVVLISCGEGDDEVPANNEASLPSATSDTTVAADTIDRADRYGVRRGGDGHQVRRQTIYIPVYSHIYIRDRERTFNLAATLSIRNTDLSNSITLMAVDYYDSEGNLVNEYLEEPVQLAALASTAFVVEEGDLRGGVGANFVVSWQADQSVTRPVVEAVMISTRSTQGISFTSPGRVISEE